MDDIRVKMKETLDLLFYISIQLIRYMPDTEEYNVFSVTNLNKL